MTQTGPRQRGFTLVETLASVSLLAVIGSALATTTVATIRANARSKDMSAASALVHDRVEAFRSMDPAHPDLAPGTHQDARNPVNPLGQTGGKFTRSWSVTANSPRMGLSTVVVTIQWSTPPGGVVRGVTYVCRTPTCS